MGDIFPSLIGTWLRGLGMQDQAYHDTIAQWKRVRTVSRKGPKYLMRGTSQVFIPLMRFLQESFCLKLRCFKSWDVGGRIAVVSWSVASRILFNIGCSILIQFPSSLFSMRCVRVLIVVSYNGIDTTTAWNTFRFLIVLIRLPYD